MQTQLYFYATLLLLSSGLALAPRVTPTASNATLLSPTANTVIMAHRGSGRRGESTKRTLDTSEIAYRGSGRRDEAA